MGDKVITANFENGEIKNKLDIEWKNGDKFSGD